MYSSLFQDSLLSDIQRRQDLKSTEKPRSTNVGIGENLVNVRLGSKWFASSLETADQIDETDETKQILQFDAELAASLPMEHLMALRLLKQVPLSYMVPDPALLPPESIRFFEVDQLWVDRMIEGAVNACTVGSADLTFSAQVQARIRSLLDTCIADTVIDLRRTAGYINDPDPQQWHPRRSENRITGMLIRSELVRRWPEMIIEPYTVDLAAIDSQSREKARTDSRMVILRREIISKSIMLLLFYGAPQSIEMREPQTGTRFGVDPSNNKEFKVDRRYGDGTSSGGEPITIQVTNNKIELSALRNSINDPAKSSWKNDSTGSHDFTDGRSIPGPREIAIHLSQPPYVQIFSCSTPLDDGWPDKEVSSDHAAITLDPSIVHVDATSGA